MHYDFLPLVLSCLPMHCHRARTLSECLQDFCAKPHFNETWVLCKDSDQPASVSGQPILKPHLAHETSNIVCAATDDGVVLAPSKPLGCRCASCTPKRCARASRANLHCSSGWSVRTRAVTTLNTSAAAVSRAALFWLDDAASPRGSCTCTTIAQNNAPLTDNSCLSGCDPAHPSKHAAQPRPMFHLLDTVKLDT